MPWEADKTISQGSRWKNRGRIFSRCATVRWKREATPSLSAVFVPGAFTNEEGVEEAEYFSSKYDSGTACDVRNLKRNSLIRYRCGESDVTLITDLKEPSTCSYVIDVETPLLCKHPKYRKRTKQVHAIRCLQIVEVDDFVAAGSYPTGIRPIPSPLRDTEFVFDEKTPQQQQAAAAEDAANILRASTPGLKAFGLPSKKAEAGSSSGVKLSGMKVVPGEFKPNQPQADAWPENEGDDDDDGGDDELDSAPATRPSLSTDGARRRIEETVAKFDQGAVTVEQLKEAIKNMPGFEHVEDMEVQILDDAHLTQDELNRVITQHGDIVQDSEPLTIPDDDDEEENEAPKN